MESTVVLNPEPEALAGVINNNNNNDDSNINNSSYASAVPCAACKLLRRKCAESCSFSPYFPAYEPLKFASVHRVFGASNVNKMIQELPVEQRGDAVSSMVYEANARIRDPIYGCAGAISSLQQQVLQLQTQLAVSQAHSVYAHMQYEALLCSTQQHMSSPSHINNDPYHNCNNNHRNIDENVIGFGITACCTPPDHSIIAEALPSSPLCADYPLAGHNYINPDAKRSTEPFTGSGASYT